MGVPQQIEWECKHFAKSVDRSTSSTAAWICSPSPWRAARPTRLFPRESGWSLDAGPAAIANRGDPRRLLVFLRWMRLAKLVWCCSRFGWDCIQAVATPLPGKRPRLFPPDVKH